MSQKSSRQSQVQALEDDPAEEKHYVEESKHYKNSDKFSSSSS